MKEGEEKGMESRRQMDVLHEIMDDEAEVRTFRMAKAVAEKDTNTLMGSHYSGSRGCICQVLQTTRNGGGKNERKK